jgi:hypothetical protein
LSSDHRLSSRNLRDRELTKSTNFITTDSENKTNNSTSSDQESDNDKNSDDTEKTVIENTEVIKTKGQEFSEANFLVPISSKIHLISIHYLGAIQHKKGPSFFLFFFYLVLFRNQRKLLVLLEEMRTKKFASKNF